jgi:hypothetical protein
MQSLAKLPDLANEAPCPGEHMGMAPEKRATAGHLDAEVSA